MTSGPNLGAPDGGRRGGRRAVGRRETGPPGRGEAGAAGVLAGAGILLKHRESGGEVVMVEGSRYGFIYANRSCSL